MQYEKKIEEIFSRHPSVQVSGFNDRTFNAGLDSMMEFDRIMGSPWRAFPSIHVAGTNGKGSVCSMLAASLSANGKKVGLYTSPHLLDFRERIKVIENGSFRMISKDEVMEFLTLYDAHIGNLSFFEITTGMAFWWYKRQGVDYAVIETGLGGRLDSTNIITPRLSIITSIGLDHCALLGNTRSAIAKEKAGIFKSGVPALVWGKDDETQSVFDNYAREIGADLHFADEMECLWPNAMLDLDLQGEYQSDNIRTTLAALSLLNENPSADAIAHTATITGLHGRWETLCDSPKVICDIGHNPAALRKNFQQLHDEGKETVIVYGIMSDKDLDEISGLMLTGPHYILCAPASQRSMPVDELHRRLSAKRPDLAACASLSTSPSVADAVRMALKKAQSLSDDAIIYIGGSTFVVAEALPLFE